MKLEDIGEITSVRCRECGREFPTFSFSSDTDMPIVGLVSLTRADNANVAVVSCLPSETPFDVQSRIGEPYRMTAPTYTNHPVRVELSFQEFRKVYRPAAVSYSCIFCGGNADPVLTISVQEFEQHQEIEVLSCIGPTSQSTRTR